MRSAAWRISLWATLAFACGTLLVFVFIHRFVASDIQRRSDAWLTGEVEVLGRVAEDTPKDRMHGRVVGEMAELAGREVPNRDAGENFNDSVFFLQQATPGTMQLWVGTGNGQDFLQALSKVTIPLDHATDLEVSGRRTPFRVASAQISDGSRIFLGLSERDERRVLRSLRLRFFYLWLVLVLLGFGIVFATTWRMLSHVRKITEAASRIGQTDLDTRVPTTLRNDEVAHLALTLNRMLDRIENSMHQLHTITDSLAHDLRSPVTAIRGKLETSLLEASAEKQAEAIVLAIDELDRLTDFLNKSLDVAEAKADALRLNRVSINLDELFESMIGLYEPSMSEKGLAVRYRSRGSARVVADAALVHRMVANLFDNELKHLPSGSHVGIELTASEEKVSLLFSDDGPGFAPEVLPHIFERRVKGRSSNGHGLGLAFVEAVVRAHGGTVSATNGLNGVGARIEIVFSSAEEEAANTSQKAAVAAR